MRLVPLVAVALLVLACGGEQTSPPPTPPAETAAEPTGAPAAEPAAAAPEPAVEPAYEVPEESLRGDPTRGAALYVQYCATCHGAGGKGDGPAGMALNPKAADHTDATYMSSLSDAGIYKAIAQGGVAVGALGRGSPRPGHPRSGRLHPAALGHLTRERRVDLPAVQIRALEKRYGEVRALAGLDLSVSQGRFFGLLGPNGAGKTTTVSILSTLLRPSAGEARVLGHDVVRERPAVRRAIGIVFQESSLDTELTGRENLDLHARLYHLDDRAKRIDRMLELVDMGRDADRPVRELSGGLRRRLEIARGLAHEPRVLFLDEPSLGLDVPARRALWEYLEALRERRDLTLILTTHSMDEAERLCDEVAVLNAGAIAAAGRPRELAASVGGDSIEIEFADPEKGAELLRSRAKVLALGVNGGSVSLTVESAATRLPELLDVAREGGVRAVRMREANLEDAFLHYTGHRIDSEGNLD
jgi:ABC-2 type transport system ATP-binding protein